MLVGNGKFFHFIFFSFAIYSIFYSDVVWLTERKKIEWRGDLKETGLIINNYNMDTTFIVISIGISLGNCTCISIIARCKGDQKRCFHGVSTTTQTTTAITHPLPVPQMGKTLLKLSSSFVFFEKILGNTPLVVFKGRQTVPELSTNFRQRERKRVTFGCQSSHCVRADFWA